MKTEITLKQKIDIRPAMNGVTIENISESYDSIIIEIKFNTELYDFIDSKDLSYEIKIIKVKGECVVAINKNDFIKNSCLANEKKFSHCKLYAELPLEYIDYENMIFESVTCFTYKFI